MGENDCRKYFLINIYERMLPDPITKKKTGIAAKEQSPTSDSMNAQTSLNMLFAYPLTHFYPRSK